MSKYLHKLRTSHYYFYTYELAGNVGMPDVVAIFGQFVIISARLVIFTCKAEILI